MFYKRFIVATPLLLLACCLMAQSNDSLKVVLSEAEVVALGRGLQVSQAAQPITVVDAAQMQRRLTGNFVQALTFVPGVQSMDIGVGFSKPMIRGMAFNRISVVADGIKQEGQQWGADHGLELDAFDVDEVHIIKGPASLTYGSDAMGGVIEVLHRQAPKEDSFLAELTLLGKSVNQSLGASLMLALKQRDWYWQARYTEQHWGDYAVPTDTVIYLTQRLPIVGRRLKNTAGEERNASVYASYRKGAIHLDLAASDAYQKVGFFAGAHGIPDPAKLVDDGNSRNIGLPYSMVNHLKLSAQLTHIGAEWTWKAVAGYQNNFRQEWSLFHSHYATQEAPAVDADKELQFALNTLNAGFKVDYTPTAQWFASAGVDMQLQKNAIAGYGFLLPDYRRATAGVSANAAYRPYARFEVTAGLRYDYGYTDIAPSDDAYLAAYLASQGYSADEVARYRIRSNAVERHFGDVSGAVGIRWQPLVGQTLKAHLGRSFRLPGANELAANGVHHGTFRHERGNAALSSERGWQLDVEYSYAGSWLKATVSPFGSWYSNYIFLRPTGEWSLLPDAGQVYEFTGTAALFGGVDAMAEAHFLRWFGYRISGEYLATYNLDEGTALAFSPPASMRNALLFESRYVDASFEWHCIAAQNRVAKNEDRTPGANLFNLDVMGKISTGLGELTIGAAVRNLFDTKYYNHLSFYRKLDIPEPGRNFQLTLKWALNQRLKNKN